jgi:hypothetical protein
MATINDRGTVDKIIRGNGFFDEEDDLRVVRIVQYNNMFNGGIAYGLIFETEPLNRYHDSPNCHNVKTLWEYKPDHSERV